MKVHSLHMKTTVPLGLCLYSWSHKNSTNAHICFSLVIFLFEVIFLSEKITFNTYQN